MIENLLLVLLVAVFALVFCTLLFSWPIEIVAIPCLAIAVIALADVLYCVW